VQNHEEQLFPDEPARFLARPLIGPQYCIEIGMRNARVSIHHLAHHSPNLRKAHLSFQKCRDRDFIGGIQDCGQRATGFSRPARQMEGGKIVIARDFELERLDLAKIKRG
jgi:hypothetical protein